MGEKRDLCGTNQPSPAPSRSVLSLGLAALTRCPVNRPRPAARLDATTCDVCLRLPGSNQLWSVYAASSDSSEDSSPPRSRDAALPPPTFLETLRDRATRPFSRVSGDKGVILARFCCQTMDRCGSGGTGAPVQTAGAASVFSDARSILAHDS